MHAFFLSFSLNHSVSCVYYAVHIQTMLIAHFLVYSFAWFAGRGVHWA